MSSASTSLAPGFTLTGTTSGSATAPIRYSINGISIGTSADTGGFDYEYYINADRTTYTVKVNGITISTNAPLDTADTIVAALRPAQSTVARTITTQAQVAAPAPTPAPNLVTNGLTPQPVTRGSLPSNATTGPTNPVATGGLTPQPITTRGTLPGNEVVPATGPLVIKPSPVTINVATLNADGNVTTKPVTITTTTGSAAAGSSSKYTVVKGDTLTAIAKKYGVTLAELIKANPQIKDPNLIYPGQVINIPAKPGATTTVDNKDPKKVTEPNSTATTEAAAKNATVNPSPQPPTVGLTAGIQSAAGGATAQDQANLNKGFRDWRVRLSLAPGANYLYNDPAGETILQPLKNTDGVIFPYTPSVQVNYAANYEGTSLTHTNYKIFQYQNSSVDQVQLTCEFTAQDVAEANYVLAVIHFFRSMTKMFYGQDSNPKNGTPPPLCYLYGMGGYQFDALPLAISGFSYSLPQDVDYIKTTGASPAGTTQPSIDNSATNSGRLGTGIASGGLPPKPVYGSTPASSGESTTWVPTKINLSITCLPIMSRNQVSNYFSLKDYASGKLLQGTKRPGGGMW